MGEGQEGSGEETGVVDNSAQNSAQKGGTMTSEKPSAWAVGHAALAVIRASTAHGRDIAHGAE
jgi:hypothetical protein